LIFSTAKRKNTNRNAFYTIEETYHIFPTNILVTIGAILALTWYGSSTLQQFYIDETRSSLLARAYSIEEQIQLLLIENKIPVLGEFIQRVSCQLPNERLLLL